MGTDTSRKLGLALIALLGVAGTVILVLQGPIPQEPGYHNFADNRTILAIPNFCDVLSNVPFLLVGLAGLYRLRSAAKPVVDSETLIAWRVLYLGITLLAFGSGWYHLAPDNPGLAWDRLTMTIGFMALFSVIIAEFVSVKTGRLMLVPLLVAGILSVIYWHYTEVQGQGDLRPYAIVQFFPLLSIPVFLLFFRSRFTSTWVWWALFACYALGKVFEYYDDNIYELSGWISGHSLKHIFAAIGLYFPVHVVNSRKPQ